MRRLVVHRSRSRDCGVPVVGIVAISGGKQAVQGETLAIGAGRPWIDPADEPLAMRTIAVVDSIDFDPVARSFVVHVARLEQLEFLALIGEFARSPFKDLGSRRNCILLQGGEVSRLV